MVAGDVLPGKVFTFLGGSSTLLAVSERKKKRSISPIAQKTSSRVI
jgi:hypothetical protein